MPSFINKIRVAARVHHPGLDNVRGFFALSPHAEFHPGPETLLELLNEAVRMVPFMRAADGAVILLRRIAIECVEPDLDVPPELIRSNTFLVTREERVQVWFENGRKIEGVLQMDLPDDVNRASDFINAADDFFPLVTRGATLLVNKSRVSGVRLYVSSPQPLESGSDGR